MSEIKIPDNVKEQIKGLLMQKATIESSLKMYIQGYMDTKGLKGDWNLDTNKWVMTEKVPEEGK